MQNLADTYNSENPILAVKPAHPVEERHPMNTYEFRPWREGDDLELLQVWGGGAAARILRRGLGRTF